ncbi:hypothetical protein D3C85_1746170 [compost metagenome]
MPVLVTTISIPGSAAGAGGASPPLRLGSTSGVGGVTMAGVTETTSILGWAPGGATTIRAFIV